MESEVNMKRCAICGKELDSGLVVHPECVPKWTAADNPPLDDAEVFICTRSKNGNRNIDKGYYLAEDGRWVHRGTAEVTHWMPLPSLPETKT